MYKYFYNLQLRPIHVSWKGTETMTIYKHLSVVKPGSAGEMTLICSG